MRRDRELSRREAAIVLIVCQVGLWGIIGGMLLAGKLGWL